MPAALLDANAVSDLMRDHPTVTARVAGHPDTVLTSVVVVGEIRFGLQRLPSGKRRSDLEARAGLALLNMPIEPVTEAIAEHYGRLKAEQESRGLNLGDNDLWIAATALELRQTLITRDGIFSSIPGLQVEDWTR
jgi:tRNA(fMet)-specific endonuclease VapC